MKMFRLLMMSAAMFFWLAGSAAAAATVKVIDGDSIVVNGVEMRLEGIDAPEYHQDCFDKDGNKYRCGEKADAYMRELVKDRKVSCEKLETDRYGRQVAICYADGEDLNKAMVAAGWAVAYDRYDKRYVETEKEARKAGRGIWQGKFMKPEFWRLLNRRK